MKTKGSHIRSLLRSLMFASMPMLFIWSSTAAQTTDTTIIFQPSNPDLLQRPDYRPLVQAWGMDLMISNNGFGGGVFYRREFSDVLSGQIQVSMNDVKDDSEIEYYTYYGTSYIPGKKNRLLHIPLHVSGQYRLFSNDITDSFRPFISAGAGPSMVYVSPYSRINRFGELETVDFFQALKYGKAHFSFGGFIGAGAMFGIDKGTLSGISLRYYFVRFPKGLEVMYGGGMIREVGGFYITINFGAFY